MTCDIALNNLRYVRNDKNSFYFYTTCLVVGRNLIHELTQLPTNTKLHVKVEKNNCLEPKERYRRHSTMKHARGKTLQVKDDELTSS